MLKKVLIRFDSAWVMSKQEDNILPVEAFLNYFSESYEIGLIRQSVTECEFVVKEDWVTEDVIRNRIRSILSGRFSLMYLKQTVQFIISDYEGEGELPASWVKTAATARRKPKAPGESGAPVEEKPTEEKPADPAPETPAEATPEKSEKPEEPKKETPAEEVPIDPVPVLVVDDEEDTFPDLLADLERDIAAGREESDEDSQGGRDPVGTHRPRRRPFSDLREPEFVPEPAETLEDVMAKVEQLVGADDFKKLANELVKVAPGLIRHKTVDTLTHQCYLFAVNDGNGLSTYINLLAKLLSVLGLVDFRGITRVTEVQVPPPGGHGRTPFSSAMSAFRNTGSAPRQVVCIDISEWMSNVGDREFREFLSFVDRHVGDSIVVFRVPFVERDVLLDLKKRIGDILFVRELSFVPFDNDELVCCARKELDRMGFSMEEDAWDVFDARITEEKTDGRFYGINTVKKVVREMIYRKQLDNACNDVDDTVIKRSEILGLAPTFESKERSGLSLLDDYVGMEAVKHRVEEIVMQIEMALKNEELGAPCIHMRFVGNPGTGKTTVARVIGKVLKERGILRNGNFFEYAGRDFCGRYVGETAPKTAAMCRDAYGSVMFIDEAYTLFRNERISGADYGREAIDTLIAQMENHRTDLVVIMAGYPDEMEGLMGANPGLESRMPYIIEFPNYTRSQLTDIYMGMARRNFTCGEGFEQAVKEYFDSLPEDVIRAKDFSNARFVRNLFERTWGKAVMRTQLNKLEGVVLEREDFLLASSEKEFKKIMEKQSRTLGFF